MNNQQQVVTIGFTGWRAYCAARGLSAADFFNEKETARTNGAKRNGTLYVQSGCMAAYIPVKFVHYTDEGETE